MNKNNDYRTKKMDTGVTIRSDKPPIGSMLLYGIVGALMMAGSIARIFVFISEGGGGAIFGILIALLIARWGYLGLQEVKKISKEYQKLCDEVCQEQEQEQREHPYREAEEFFLKARDAGISDLDSEANVSRLLLYAKNHDITLSQQALIDQFQLGRQWVEDREAKTQAEQERERLEALREQEAALQQQCTQYADCTDGEKSIRYCQHKIDEANSILFQCQWDEAGIRSGGNSMYQAGRQKEASWAVQGGLASGIAGGAAGLAVAMDTQRRNQEKRRQNEALASSIGSLSATQLQKVYDREHLAKQELEHWRKELETAKILLSEKHNPKQLLSMMQPRVQQWKVTETGAVQVKIALRSTPNLVIFDDIKAVADGSIQVLLKVDGEIVGNAICDLPYGGMTRAVTVDGICCTPKQKVKKYTFEVVPNHLWAVETKDNVAAY